MSEIIVVGSINMDLVVRIERAPDGGETINMQPVSLSWGVGFLEDASFMVAYYAYL